MFHHSAVVVVEHARLIDRSRSQTLLGVTFPRVCQSYRSKFLLQSLRCHLLSGCQLETLVDSRELGAPLLFILVE